MEADELSKMTDKDDWQLHSKWFRVCDQRWGPHNVDRFASDLNALFPRFFSRFYCPGCEGIDSFGAHWGHEGDNNWINPPFGLIGRVLRKLRADRARATVVIHVWPSRPWWHLVAADGLHMSDVVVGWSAIPRSSETFLPGRFSGNQHAHGSPKWKIIVVRFDYSDTAPPCTPLGNRCLDGGCGYCCSGRHRH